MGNSSARTGEGTPRPWVLGPCTIVHSPVGDLTPWDRIPVPPPAPLPRYSSNLSRKSQSTSFMYQFPGPSPSHPSLPPAKSGRNGPLSDLNFWLNLERPTEYHLSILCNIPWLTAFPFYYFPLRIGPPQAYEVRWFFDLVLQNPSSNRPFFFCFLLPSLQSSFLLQRPGLSPTKSSHQTELLLTVQRIGPRHEPLSLLTI